LAGGSIDAFAGVEPFCALAESLGYSELLINYEKYDQMPNMLASNSKFVTNSPKLATSRGGSDGGSGRDVPDAAGKGGGNTVQGLRRGCYRMDRETLGMACTSKLIARGRESEIHSGT
jgi:hypothetical protein